MNILVTGAWQGFGECEEELEKAGHRTAFLQWEKDELPVDADWVEGIIGNGIFLSHPIEKFTNLRYIQLTSAGYDRVPMEYVEACGIEIHNAGGVYSIPMAEFAVGCVLQLFKQLPVFEDSQKKHQWKKIRTLRELAGSTVCIIGCGSVGTECAKRFRSFGCTVTGINRSKKENQYFDHIGRLSELDQRITEADIVILTLPLTDESRGLIGREQIRMMKKDAVLVNISRGGVMDYDAFVELKQGERKDLQAVFDVLETEPLEETSPLWEMPGVIITPHNSFAGEGNQRRLNQVILENLKGIYLGDIHGDKRIQRDAAE